MLVWPRQGARGVKEAKATVELKRTGYGVKIALAAAFAVLVIGYGLFVAIYLIAMGHFAPFWSMETLASAFSVLVNLILMAILWANVRGLIMRRKRARALSQRDSSVVSDASPQFAPSLALPVGETLTLACHHNLNTKFHNLTAIIYYAYLLIVSETIIFQALPVFGHSALNPYFHSEFDGPVAPPPTTLDWLAAGLPFLLVTCVVGYLAWRDIRDRLHRIVAEDTGLTIRDGLRQRTITWSEIEVFARITDGSETAPVGNYVLWGRSKSLNFAIVAMEQEVDPDRDYVPSWQTRYSFTGGYATYSKDAQRLLSTIAARAQTPLLTVRVTTPFSDQRRGLPAIASLSETEALALPWRRTDMGHWRICQVLRWRLANRSRSGRVPGRWQSLATHLAISVWLVSCCTRCSGFSCRRTRSGHFSLRQGRL